MKFKEYSKTLPLAREIYFMVKGPARTHKEWAESFNTIGDINKLIIKKNGEEKSGN